VFGGELHPFVVHFAVGLLLIAPICDVAGLLLRREALLYAGRWTTLLGAVAAVLALWTGFGAEAVLGPHSAAGDPLLRLHKALTYVVLAVWVPVAAWRIASKLPLPLRARTLYLAAAFTGGVVLTVEAALGNAMVYRHGLGLSPGARAEPVIRSAQTPR
jgi:uncharacterized membrane protein